MLKFLKNKKFIGDLSLEDADVICQYALQANSVLEFGVGGSTQLLSQCRCDNIISVDTDQNWIDTTKRRLSKIHLASPVKFQRYEDPIPHDMKFDIIFVDGVDHLRREFAINTWSLLKESGIMIFHDTRRFNDFQNVAWVSQLYFNEISKIEVNIPSQSNGKSSNLSIIYKKRPEPYVNWNLVEGKPMWAYGDPNYNADIPSWERHA